MTDYKALVADAQTMLRDAEVGSRVERNNMIGHLVEAVEELETALASKHLTDRESLAQTLHNVEFDIEPVKHSVHAARFYAMADAILASPSLSLVAVRDEVAAVIFNHNADARESIIRYAEATMRMRSTADSYADALFASGVLKPSSEAEAAALEAAVEEESVSNRYGDRERLLARAARIRREG